MGLRYRTEHFKGIDNDTFKTIRGCFESNRGSQDVCPKLSNARNILESNEMFILENAITYLPGVDSELKKLGWEKHGKTLRKVFKHSGKVEIILQAYDTVYCDSDFIYLGNAHTYADGGNKLIVRFQQDYFIENGFESLDVLSENLIKVLSNPAFSKEISIVFGAENWVIWSTCSKEKFLTFLRGLPPIIDDVISYGESRQKQASREIGVYRKEAEKAKEYLEEVKVNNTPSYFYKIFTRSKYNEYFNQKDTYSEPYNKGLYITAKEKAESQVPYYQNWKKSLTQEDVISNRTLGLIVFVVFVIFSLIVIFGLLIYYAPTNPEQEAEKKQEDNKESESVAKGKKKTLPDK